MHTEQQKSNAGYTILNIAVAVSLFFGLTASILLATPCQYASDGNKKCEAKADPATIGQCDGGCAVGQTCTGSKTEYDYNGCDECKASSGSSCSEYLSPWTTGCTDGYCSLKSRTKNCTCFGPTSNKTCGIDPADSTDWGAPTTVRQDECF
jgi:hypothetical protein